MEKLKEILFEEKGNAAAELVVLLPVYLVLVFGMLFLGEMVLAQQAAEKAARYMAWSNGKQSNLAKAHFSYSYNNPNLSTPNVKKVRQGIHSNSISSAVDDANNSGNNVDTGSYSKDEFAGVMTRLLNGPKEPTLTTYRADVSFRYGVIGLIFTNQMKVDAYHYVTLTRENSERVKKSKKGYRHSIEEFGGLFNYGLGGP